MINAGDSTMGRENDNECCRPPRFLSHLFPHIYEHWLKASGLNRKISGGLCHQRRSSLLCHSQAGLDIITHPLIIHRQALFTIDINGQMDEQVEIIKLFLSSNSHHSVFGFDHIFHGLLIVWWHKAHLTLTLACGGFEKCPWKLYFFRMLSL